MILVVSDTSPLNYLVLIGVEHVLPSLYGSVVIPSQVLGELTHAETPAIVRDWALNLPNWIEVWTGDASRFPTLDEGEAAALEMALSSNAKLLVDEADARLMAHSLGVATIGTIGILTEAHEGGLVGFESAIEALAQTNFRVHASVINQARDRLFQQAEKLTGSGGDQH